MNITKSYTVSVCMITYGHEAYIRKAIEGVLMQLCDFEVELIIADDSSSDNTQQIIKDIKKGHPKGKWISYIRHGENKGMIQNFGWALKRCQGQFIALCEGDDYWTDPFKLQKQVDFLESHKHINLCFSNVELLVGEEVREHSIKTDFMERPISYSKLLEHHNFIVTASVLFRRPTNFEFPDWFYALPYGDMGLYKLLANGDSFYGLKDVMAVYRVHDQGAYSGLGKLQSRKIYYQFYRSIFPFLNKNEKEVSTLKMKALRKEIGTLKFKRNLFLGKVYSVGLKFGLVE